MWQQCRECLGTEDLIFGETLQFGLKWVLNYSHGRSLPFYHIKVTKGSVSKVGWVIVEKKVDNWTQNQNKYTPPFSALSEASPPKIHEHIERTGRFPRNSTPAAYSNTHNPPATMTNITTTAYPSNLERNLNVRGQVIERHATDKHHSHYIGETKQH